VYFCSLLLPRETNSGFRCDALEVSTMITESMECLPEETSRLCLLLPGGEKNEEDGYLQDCKWHRREERIIDCDFL